MLNYQRVYGISCAILSDPKKHIRSSERIEALRLGAVRVRGFPGPRHGADGTGGENFHGKFHVSSMLKIVSCPPCFACFSCGKKSPLVLWAH